jgi:valyl-tRNA synthetase (EC 6.1.1.9)
MWKTRLYKAWEEGGCFRHGIKSGKPYTIALPPPNVTGSLHMGHASITRFRMS